MNAAFEAGETYHLSAWLKGELDAEDSPDPGRWALHVRFYDSGGVQLGGVYTAAAVGLPGSLTPTWTQFGGTVTAPPDAARATVGLAMHLTSGWVTFDDVAFVKQFSYTKYYYAGAQRVAMDKDGTRSYLFGDHLGSTSVVMPTTFGVQPVYARYKPWGESRDALSATLPTDYRFTGQRWHENIGLYNYNARWYDTYLNHWTQPDSIIPDPGNSADFDRYAYVRNNPLLCP